MELLLDPLQFEYSCELSDKLLVFRCSRQGELMKCEYINGTDTGNLVALKNSEGVYLLEKSDLAWQLSDAKRPTDFLPQLQRVESVPRIGFSLNANVTLLDVAKKPNQFILKKSQYVNDYHQLNLEYKLSDGKNELAIFKLEPRKRYRIISITYSELDGSDPATYSFSYSDDSLIGEVVPMYWDCKTARKSWKVNTIKQAPIPNAEYSLSYYGLPNYKEQNSVAFWLWGGVIATAVLVILFLTGVRRKL